MKKAEMKHWLNVYRQLNKTPIEAPCDVCDRRIHPNRVQGCDTCGCGPVNLYVRLKAYAKLQVSEEKEDKNRMITCESCGRVYPSKTYVKCPDCLHSNKTGESK